VSIREKYGGAEQFLTTFNPDMQSMCMKHQYRSFCGYAPELVRVAKTYGEKVAKLWVISQLHNLAIYAFGKTKLNGEHENENEVIRKIDSLAGIIASNYSYLKVTEVMVFFSLFKAGKYGRFYGSFDPLVITTALNEFVDKYRKFMLEKIEKYQLDKKQSEAGKPIKLEEYLAKCEPVEGGYFTGKLYEENKEEIRKPYKDD
jgi:hypothetical protein